MDLTFAVCVVCRDPARSTERYEVVHGNRRKGADLCQTHAEPLEHLLRLKTPGERNRPRKPARVKTLAEIEALKTGRTHG